MTRPQIIRADTIDLQDKTSPTAQDHSLQPVHPAPLGIGPAAPHQQSALNHVADERHSEEEILSQAFNAAQAALADEPPSGDEHNRENTVNGHAKAEGQQNGDNSDENEEMADSEAEDGLDDDMMDKISSSPSIDDGSYILSSTQRNWPKRCSSLTPGSSPIRTTPTVSPVPHNVSPTPGSGDMASSSPFTITPMHMPLSVARYFKEAKQSEDPPSSPPTFSPSQLPTSPWSKDHHRRRQYIKSWSESDLRESKNECDKSNERETPAQDEPAQMPPPGEEEYYEPEEAITSVSEQDLRNLLLPDDDPLLDSSFDDYSAPSPISSPTTPDAPPSSPTTSDADWETDSEESYTEGEDDDDTEDRAISLLLDPRPIDSGCGGESLRELEDIDFEFVYALHTFVATVEGQANATKGDTMVLLDDSNSYWWLVRIVKDSTIGYLPAEHIETPTERLARLNKHRNIDLSATMLSDNAEKTKNPLKKAMRRRNAKTVQFAAPTYVEPSDYEYSSDEDNGEHEHIPNGEVQTKESIQNDEQEEDATATVEPLKLGAKKELKEDDQSTLVGSTNGEEIMKDGTDEPRTSNEIFDRPLEPRVTKNGNVRNTDSFFKDDSVETRKITLTPNLLRDDSSGSTTRSSEGKDRAPSLDSLEKASVSSKESKDDKKKKEKKPGMIRSLFGRKDKKGPGAKVDELDAVQNTSGRGSPASGNSMEAPIEILSGTGQNEAAAQPQRQTSKGKLQKQQKGVQSLPKQMSPDKEKSEEAAPRPTVDTSVNASSMRIVSPEPQQNGAKSPQRIYSPEPQQESDGKSQSRSLGGMLNRNDSDKQAKTKPEKVKKAKQRMDLDDFDSSPDVEKVENPLDDVSEVQHQEEPRPLQTNVNQPSERLSESPVEVSPVDAQPSHDISLEDQAISPVSPQTTQAFWPDRGQQPSQARESPIQTAPSTSTSTSSSTPLASALNPSPSPPPDREVAAPQQLRTAPQSYSAPQQAPPTKAPPNPPARLAPSPPHSNDNTSLPSQDESPSSKDNTPPSSTATTPQSQLPPWSDASLRAYLDDGSDIRDMLVVIHDTSGVEPVSMDHEILKGLWGSERESLGKMSKELDSLLGGWIESKSSRRAPNGLNKAVPGAFPAQV